MIRKCVRLLNEARHRLFIDLGDHRNTVFLAGTGRSGTTWIQELVNYNNDYRIMFEPFHSNKIDQIKHWNYRQYLKSDDQRKRYIDPAECILSGNIKHPWIDARNHKLVVRKRLIKDIRTQLILHWISQKFPDIPIVLLLRHPCAVANSKIKLGWDSHLNDFLTQRELVNDYLEPFRNHIQKSEDIFDNHIFLWCIENYIPLTQFSENQILVTFYETICENTQSEAERIFSFLGRSLPESILEKAAKPSTLSREWSAVVNGSDSINSWRKNISHMQIKRAVDILQIFGMDRIYNETSIPLVSGQEVLNLFGTEDSANVSAIT